MGAFNIIVSLLPPKIVTVAEMIGFPANREYGLQELKLCYEENGFFSDLASMFLCGFHSEVDKIQSMCVSR